MSERMQRPVKPPGGEDPDGDNGPRRPNVKRPDTKSILERMKKVPPNKARDYANPKNIGQ